MADINFDILSWNVRGLGDYQTQAFQLGEKALV